MTPARRRVDTRKTMVLASRAPAAVIVVISLVMALPACQRGDAAVRSAAASGYGAGELVRLVAFDRRGARLSLRELLDRSSNAPHGWRSDVTYRVADGTIATAPALVQDHGVPALRLTEPGLGLSLAWPTARTGYSTLFIDAGGDGFPYGGPGVSNSTAAEPAEGNRAAATRTVNLTYRAALDYRRKFQEALDRRPAFIPGRALRALRARASALLTRAAETQAPAARGALGARALDRLAQAFERLLVADGRRVGASRDPWWGVTVDRTEGIERTARSIEALVRPDRGSPIPGTPVARVVFDPGRSPGSYADAVRELQRRGVRVAGQFADSSAMRRYDDEAWQRRVRTFLDRFPDIDIWEVGNEVNGGWLGPGVASKVATAAREVKSRDPTDIVMLTLYWQMGTAPRPSASVFEWIHDHVSPGLIADVDVLSLSLWVADAPLGIAQDEVFKWLQDVFPEADLMIGELGYWERGTPRSWWWRRPEHPRTIVRRALLRQQVPASLGVPGGRGGVFWWYYVSEMADRGRLWRDLRGAIVRVARGGAP